MAQLRRSRLLAGILCVALAMPIQIADLIGHVGLFWRLVSLALVVVGAVTVNRELRRMKRNSAPSAEDEPQAP